MRAAIYDRFWHSMGGGERHAGMIAQLLSQEGVEVDLLGHTAVDRDDLAAHLGLDLSKTTLRVVRDKGDAALAALSADYDLFVNATYMSGLVPRARRATYLCFFPTPFDHDLPRWRRLALRAVGPRLRRYRHQLAIGWGTGWFPPEGGRRRQWAWTSGDGILNVEPGPTRAIQLDIGRPGTSKTVELTVDDGSGEALGRVPVTPQFSRHVFTLPGAKEGRELHFRSETFVPGPTDTRELGVALSRPRLAGQRLGPAALLATRFPWLLRDPRGTEFLSAYDTVLANSQYTASWIRRLWHVEADVLYPPIQVDRLHPVPARERVILTVGRFFAPGLGHAKRQLEMVRFFGDMVRRGQLAGWTMHVVGGCEPFQLPYLEKVREAAAGLPVEIHPNAPRDVVERLMSTASIFWSATGYGENEEKKPWSHEHFGMTTAEAMAGGCVPVVIDKAGQREIVRDDIDGFRWSTPAQLAERTCQIANDEALRKRLAAAATQRAQQYSDEAFALRWRDIAGARDLLG
jgi:glycosyltransferase involved in cell wall biosynthesis